jgi:hypothetical protein
MPQATPNGDTLPAEVTPYLLPIELQAIAMRRHLVVLTSPACLLVADVTAFALGAAGVIPGGAAALAILGALFAPSCYFLYRSVLTWWHAFFVVTFSRVILINWQQKRPPIIISLTKISDMTFSRTPLGRLIGYGSFELEMSDPREHTLEISYVPYPEQLYLEVAAMIFGQQ